MYPGFYQLLIIGGLIAFLIIISRRGRLSEMMGDVALGIKSFRKGIADDEDPTLKKVEKSDTIDGDETVGTKEKEAHRRSDLA